MWGTGPGSLGARPETTDPGPSEQEIVSDVGGGEHPGPNTGRRDREGYLHHPPRSSVDGSGPDVTKKSLLVAGFDVGQLNLS